MLKADPIFDNYERILENYIKSWEKNDQVFSILMDNKLNPNYPHLKSFFELIGIQPNLEKFSTITKAILSARKGKVTYLDYPHFKNVAHYVLDYIPDYWTHFRLVLKIYEHKELIKDILKDEKIKIKLNKKNILSKILHIYIILILNFYVLNLMVV